MTKRAVKSNEICEISKHGESAANKCKFSQTAPKQIRKNQPVQKIEIACKSQFK